MSGRDEKKPIAPFFTSLLFEQTVFLHTTISIDSWGASRIVECSFRSSYQRLKPFQKARFGSIVCSSTNGQIDRDRIELNGFLLAMLAFFREALALVQDEERGCGSFFCKRKQLMRLVPLNCQRRISWGSVDKGRDYISTFSRLLLGCFTQSKRGNQTLGSSESHFHSV